MNLEKQRKNVENGFGTLGSVTELRKRLLKMSDNQLLHKLEVSERELQCLETSELGVGYSYFAHNPVHLENIRGQDKAYVRVLKDEKKRREL